MEAGSTKMGPHPQVKTVNKLLILERCPITRIIYNRCCGSGMFIPDQDYYIPDHGSKKAPGYRIRNKENMLSEIGTGYL